jgi:hypothetical protein
MDIHISLLCNSDIPNIKRQNNIVLNFLVVSSK